MPRKIRSLEERLRHMGFCIPFTYIDERRAEQLTDYVTREYNSHYKNQCSHEEIRAAVGFLPPFDVSNKDTT